MRSPGGAASAPIGPCDAAAAENDRKTFVPMAPSVTAPGCAPHCALPEVNRVIHSTGRAQRQRRPQPVTNRAADIHSLRTGRGHRWPAPTPCCPQCAQHLLLLLISILQFLLEEASWGHRAHMPSESPERRRCRRDRLAFKLRRKALRWFIDSRCARCTVPARAHVRWRENR